MISFDPYVKTWHPFSLKVRANVAVVDNYDKDVINECKRAGAKGYIVRPYKPTYVKAEIKRVLLGRSIVE